MKYFNMAILLMAMITVSYAAFGANTVTLNKNLSKVGFEIIKFKIGAPVMGEFKDFEGNGQYDFKTKSLYKMNVLVKVASIDTANTDRNKHLLSDENFFNEKKFKNIVFKVPGLFKLKEGVKVVGTMTIKGISKKITLVISKVSLSKDKTSFVLDGVINRLDYNVTWNSPMEKSDWKIVLGKLGKFVIDDEVKIKFSATFQK